MEDIKEAVGKALEKKGVLSKLRAELRANVFFAIDEQEQNNGGEGLSQKTNTNQRQSLIDTPEGLQLFGLVHDFLVCASLDFTTQVYEAEAGLPDGFLDRSQLVSQLKLSDTPDSKPLLLSLLKRGPFSGGHADGGKPAPVSTGGTSALPPPAARPKLTPLAPVETAKQPAAAAKSTSQPIPPGAAAAGGAAATAKATPPISQQKPAAAAAPANASLSDLPSIGGPKLNAAPPARAPPPPAPAPAPPPAVMPEPSSNTSYGDDGDDFEMEEEIPEDNSNAADEDEDYASYFGGAPPPASQAPKLPTSPKAQDDELSDSNLSNSGATSPGRIRKSKLSIQSKAIMPEELPNDRSFGVSAELSGYGAHPPPPRIAKESSGGLSFSGELPRSMEIDSRLSTLPPKPLASKLEPLGAPKGLSANKLALAPIGLKPSLAPLSSSKEDPLTKGRGLRQSSEDIRDDLRRSGLISSDSIGCGSASQSMEIPDMAAMAPHHPYASSSGGGAGHSGGGASSVRPGASHVYDEELSVSNSMMDITSEQEAPLPALAHIPGGGLKTAVPGFGRISEVSTLAEEEMSRGSLYGPASVSRGSLGGRGAVSLDFRDTGLSADDNSGELDKLLMGADMNETAEWVS